jgi:hypothetical protein
MRKQQQQLARCRRFSPLALVGISVPLVLTIMAATVSLSPLLGSHAAETLNGDCTLIVPANPLTARGLATPYQLVATNHDQGKCQEANPAQAAFVQAAVLNPDTGNISIYNPLVIDQGTRPAIPPVVPKLPREAIVGIWFGFNGNNLTLQDTENSLRAGRCVNGVHGSIFGQFAYCNAPAFFSAANRAIQTGKLVPPPLGTGKDGLPCPSVRDFGVVDQDQSDNVTTTYLVTDGRIAQATRANAVGGSQTLVNPSDNRLLAVALDNALGCKPWKAPDLADPGQKTTALPLNELQAAAHQDKPVAVVPAGDPMVLVNQDPNLAKVNAYRLGVDQPTVDNLGQANTRAYCRNLLDIAPERIQRDKRLTQKQASPDPAAANNLFTFLAQRFVTTYGANGLNCIGLLKKPDPITLTKNDDGVTINATIHTR